MSVSRDEVARIAALAAMRVDDDAMPELVRQMTRILDYVSQLAEVDAGTLSAFRPQSNGEPQALRADVVMRHEPPLTPRDFAPDMRDGLFIVPRVGGFGEGDGA